MWFKKSTFLFKIIFAPDTVFDAIQIKYLLLPTQLLRQSFIGQKEL